MISDESRIRSVAHFTGTCHGYIPPPSTANRYRCTGTDTLIQTHGHTHASFHYSLFLQVSCWPFQLWYGVCAKCPAPLLLSTTVSCPSHPQRSYETGGQFIYFGPCNNISIASASGQIEIALT